jgi:hypothetical protein
VAWLFAYWQAKYSITASAKDSFGDLRNMLRWTFHATAPKGNIKAIEFQRLVGMGWFALFSRHSPLGFQWANSTHFR